MGRKCIGRRPMTAAERQRRRRKRLKRERSSELTRLERLKRREKYLEKFVPSPPGITYWREVKVRAGRDAKIMMPVTQPLAACAVQLTDEEVVSLIEQLHKIARERGLPHG